MSEYRQYLNAVGRCGYFDSYPNGQNGAPVEKMAIFPTVGGMENLKELAKSNGVRFEVEAKKLDGIYQECITFVRRDHVDFATKAASCYKIGKIKDGASKSFDLYIENFVEEKKNITWPKNRMLQTEWDTLNKLLEPFKLGVRDFGGRMTLVNYGAVQEKQDLRSKASKNFEQYLDLLLTSGESRGLPSFRMSDDEWQKLNEELKPRGVKLEKVDGYMWFRKIVTQKDLARATDNLKEKLFKELKAKYPNIPDKNLRTIVELDDADAIYYYLRHVMPGDEYLHPTAEEYESAKMWHRGHGVAGGVESVVYDNYNWYCRRYVAPDREPRPNRQGEGFHMSLNVNLTDGTLRNLDKVLAMDKGHSIRYYKFPISLDTSHRRYDVITIYLYNRNPEIEAALARAVAPYVRDNHGLIGKMVGPGVSIVEETGKKYNGRSVGEHEADIILSELRGARRKDR